MSLHRRAFTGALVASTVFPQRAAAEPQPAIVTLFGDSIVAGYGLPPEQGLAAALQAELQRLGVITQVRNAGFPGDTSAGGRGRMHSAVRRDTTVCIVEFGGNDRARGYPPSVTRENLDAIVADLKARGISVVLLGLAMPERPGNPDAGTFNAVFADVAKANGARLCADFMSGVTKEAGLRQADGIHPNAEGARLIARNIAPVVAQALNAHG